MPERPIALVTGASRGIGAAVARSLSDTHDLLLGGRDADALQALVDELPGAKPWPVELTDHDAVAAAAADIDRLDVVVHSAGLVELASVADATSDSWRRTFELNLFAVTELTRLLLPALRASKGHVVLVNSGAGLSAKPNWGSYAASKFALRAFADVLRAEEAANGVRVTSVFPGRTATDMQRGIREQEGAEFQPDDYLRPESVAGPIVSAVRASADAHLTEIVIRPS
ncbi:NADP-dependent 3-hydroxy acid dehydrogenase YdfG [Saccharopolyspora kobensis]|uniref:NADP-dependent 3-hydroxy acid dehydrogenase YdfG n=1 Tax=Saccharopolyspora kobensis TaxID=146035 RepID=A0A1H6EGW3_9PSEU|nr:SDR family oxidoreductase [Saccharopolyspora kobensis]SEG96186.1 NADP-dependent 3-hydroxy acid dehydrogenase YdfG [Saccharopolyspora kobensis]SFD21577.1 NADP-dependent 3-hydroxy acid dehydrogenase YdfG [Saccharopolyspora kobensis]